jgi:hypothetical protein
MLKIHHFCYGTRPVEELQPSGGGACCDRQTSLTPNLSASCKEGRKQAKQINSNKSTNQMQQSLKFIT